MSTSRPDTQSTLPGPPLPADLTRVRRHPERGSHDPATLHAILDDALVCHVGFVDRSTGTAVPVVIPTGFGRRGDEIVLHGSPGSRMMRALGGGDPVCVTVTVLDGLVLARSAMHSSMNYRSVVVFGHPRPITDPAEKRAALDAFVEHVVPGRTREARPMTDAEIAGTAVVALSLDRASAKVRTGPPKEPAEDVSFPVWAGVVPLALRAGSPEPAPDLAPGFEPPSAARRKR